MAYCNSACDVSCDTSHADVQAPIVKQNQQNRLFLVLLNVTQSEVMQRMGHNLTYKYQVSLYFNMTHNLYELVSPLTLYLNVKNAQNPM